MDVRFNLNLAQAHIKKREFSKAIEHADNALARDASNTKALYRKSNALMETLNFSEAVQLLQQLLVIDPDNKAAKDMLQKAKRSEAKGELRARRIAQKIFGGRASQQDGPTLLQVVIDKVRRLCCPHRSKAD
mmetsp:Transcript_49192/g.110355  ORF Transcript_49192/g.110355 Transcript_49192/m.110355 type:complete len:132 (+) Transcript_49192:286-681(+)